MIICYKLTLRNIPGSGHRSQKWLLGELSTIFPFDKFHYLDVHQQIKHSTENLLRSSCCDSRLSVSVTSPCCLIQVWTEVKCVQNFSAFLCSSINTTHFIANMHATSINFSLKPIKLKSSKDIVIFGTSVESKLCQHPHVLTADILGSCKPHIAWPRQTQKLRLPEMPPHRVRAGPSLWILIPFWIFIIFVTLCRVKESAEFVITN